MGESTTEARSLEEQVAALAAQLARVQQVSALNSKIDRLKFYRDEDAREWGLLSNRVNAYVTSQSFLVTATAIALGNTAPHGHIFRLVFPLILQFVGISTSILSYQGITSAMDMIRLWKDKSAALTASDAAEHENAIGDYLVIRNQKYNWMRVVNRDIFARFHADAADPEMDEIHVRSLKFALLTPWFFGFAWVLFAALEIYLFLLTTLGYK